MSEISSKHEKIINSPINRSKSKHTFSFSKSMRFEELKSPASKTFVYELPDLKSIRSTTMGFGKKFDFMTKQINENAPFYDIPSDFNAKKPQSPAFSFGIARNFYEKVYSPSGKILDRNIPGPGNYNHQKPLGSDALKFSLFGRRGGTKIFDKILDNPGPGEYEQVNIKETGKYPVSNFRNTTNSIQWANDKEDRFFRKKNSNPGPGHYQLKPLFDGSGVTFVSRFKSSTARSLGGRLRELSNKNQTPGPGSYSSFSEFGIPKSKYDKKDSEREYASRLTYDKSKRSEYLSGRNSLSNGFIRVKSDKFNKDYKNDIERPINNYQRFLENDDEKLLSRKINIKEGNNFKSSEYNLRFDYPEPEKKTQHISELDIKQNESEPKENSIKNKSHNSSTKPRIEIETNNKNDLKTDKVSMKEKSYYNKIDLNSLKKPMEKKATDNSDSSNRNHIKPTRHITNNNLEKSVKSDIIKNSEKNEEASGSEKEKKSKVSSVEAKQDNKSLDSFQMQTKLNREEFLRKTENSIGSKRLIATNNSKNIINTSSFTNNVSVKSDLKNVNNKSKLSNFELKSNKGQSVNNEPGVSNKSGDSKEHKTNFKEVENKSIKSGLSKNSVANSNNQNAYVNKEMSISNSGKGKDNKMVNIEE